MDPREYDLAFFHREGMHRRVCRHCGHAFWTLGDHDRCQEAPCQEYAFVGHSPFRRPYAVDEMREAYLRFFERRGHTRLARYPVVARWRNDVFFTQASVYDFQPWVTSGAIPPPANPLTISQPCLRFVDLEEVGRSGRHFTLFEMMAHHAFNRPDHEVYFKDRCTALCHELLTEEFGVDPRAITYKEEEWEGGGNLGPSLSVGVGGLEVATLVFMEYIREGDRIRPMPITVVDTGYGLERYTWISQGTKTAYEAVFAGPYEELRQSLPAYEASVVIDHARALNFMLTDGVVPSNAKEGYFARLLIRRALRLLARAGDPVDLIAVIDRVGRDLARTFPEIGRHRDDRDQILAAEIERFREAIERARPILRRQEERLAAQGRSPGTEELVEWYDSLGIPPDVAAGLLQRPPPVPENFYQLAADRHAQEAPANDYQERGDGLPEVPATVPPTEVGYPLDPYTLTFDARVVWAEGPFVVLDRTYFYPTGGGQLHDTGTLGDAAVVDVVRRGPHVLHRLDRAATARVGERQHGRIDAARRTQLMQHHTATHIINGTLRTMLGPHVWQAGAYKGPELARIDVTHYRPLSDEELWALERRINEVVRENHPVRSYFEPRTEAERRFGFTLYQGGAVPGKELRIVEIEGVDVEACGGTHCTHTSEVGAIDILSVERIQDGVLRLTYASGLRALELRRERDRALREAARQLGVPPERVPEGVQRLLEERDAARRQEQERRREGLDEVARRLLDDPAATVTDGGRTVVAATVELDRKGLGELSRRICAIPGRVAVLAATGDGRGTLFVGSSAPERSAVAILGTAMPLFAGKGGGNPSAATAVGEPGEPLRRALATAREAALRGRIPPPAAGGG
ncbi:MAG: alanine--tRNA ligase [Thermoplasmata archaeon]